MASNGNVMLEDNGSNLIVNYIPPSFTDEQLSDLFAPFGTVESAKIVKEKPTQKSLGYGFVKFPTAEQAEKAIQALNGKQLEGKRLKVAIARPQGVGDKNCNLYVAGLEPHYTREDLHTMFSVYGNVLETKILIDHTSNQSRGVGFVRYETAEQAAQALQALNNVTLAGTSKPLVVRLAEKKDRRPMMGGPMGGQMNRGGNFRFNPFVYGQQVASMYQYPGVDATWAYGSAFGQQNMGYSAGQMPVPSTPSGGSTYCLFVYNLPAESDDSYLYQLFGPYGAVANVKVMRDLSTGQCKGFGFVNMVKLEDAQAAIAALNGAQIGPKQLQVSFKKDNNFA